MTCDKSVILNLPSKSIEVPGFVASQHLLLGEV